VLCYFHGDEGYAGSRERMAVQGSRELGFTSKH